METILKNVIDTLPKSIDFRMNRYNLKVIHLEDTIPDNADTEHIKIYYRSNSGVLNIATKNFCIQGLAYQATYDMLLLITDNIRYLTIPTADDVDIKHYSDVLDKLYMELTKLEIKIKSGGFN